jgi:hypothetical protein
MRSCIGGGLKPREAAQCRNDHGVEGYKHHAVMFVLAILWVAGNFYLWSLKQSPPALFWQPVGMGLVAYPALYFYVTHRK